MSDNQPPLPPSPTPPEFPDAPLSHRFTRGTVIGCLGIACVLVLPLVFFLPLETWNLPRWALLAVQLVAFAGLGAGVWLLAHVPSSAREQSNDPRRPLTARGALPVLERPARWQNQVGVGVVLAVLALAIVGFALAAFATKQQSAIPLGMGLVCLSGLSLAVFGVGIALGRLQPPALRWVRTPAMATWLPQGGSVTLLGLTLAAWALLILMEAHYAWGAIGLVILLLATVLIAPAFRRFPIRRS